jgi:hypothetical protein
VTALGQSRRNGDVRDGSASRQFATKLLRCTSQLLGAHALGKAKPEPMRSADAGATGPASLAFHPPASHIGRIAVIGRRNMLQLCR